MFADEIYHESNGQLPKREYEWAIFYHDDQYEDIEYVTGDEWDKYFAVIELEKMGKEIDHVEREELYYA